MRTFEMCSMTFNDFWTNKRNMIVLYKLKFLCCILKPWYKLDFDSKKKNGYIWWAADSIPQSTYLSIYLYAIEHFVLSFNGNQVNFWLFYTHIFKSCYEKNRNRTLYAPVKSSHWDAAFLISNGTCSKSRDFPIKPNWLQFCYFW